MSNGVILYLAADPERAQGQDLHRGSEEQTDEVRDERKLTLIRAEPATNKVARNIMVSQWTLISTRGTFYDEYTSSYIFFYRSMNVKLKIQIVS